MKTISKSKKFSFEISEEFLDQWSACDAGVRWLEKQKTRDALKVLELLQKSKQWGWHRWLLARLMVREQRVEWAIFAAREVLPIYEKKYPGKDAPRKAIEAAEAWLKSPCEENRRAVAQAAQAANAAYADAVYADVSDAAYAANASANAADAVATYTGTADLAADAVAYAATYADDREKLRIKIAKHGIMILNRDAIDRWEA